MLDPLIRRYASPPATRIAALGLSPTALTVAGFALGIAAVPAIERHAYAVALALIAVGRLLDAAGAISARPSQPEPFADYTGRILDLIWTASVPFAFALAEPDRALAAMFLVFGLTVRAVTPPIAGQADPPGRVLEAGGRLVEKSELFVAYALACVFPDRFSIIAYTLGMLCFVMVGFRVARAGLRRS